MCQGFYGIDMSRNKIGDAGSKKLLESLASHTDLHFLGFANCDITNNFLSALC